VPCMISLWHPFCLFKREDREKKLLQRRSNSKGLPCNYDKMNGESGINGITYDTRTQTPKQKSIWLNWSLFISILCIKRLISLHSFRSIILYCTSHILSHVDVAAQGQQADLLCETTFKGTGTRKCLQGFSLSTCTAVSLFVPWHPRVFLYHQYEWIKFRIPSK